MYLTSHKSILSTFVIFLSLLILLFSFDVNARRLGNGGSYGKQFSNIGKMHNNSLISPSMNKQDSYKRTYSNKSSKNNINKKKSNQSFLGMILTSLGLAYLLSHFGFVGVFNILFFMFLLLSLYIFAFKIARKYSYHVSKNDYKETNNYTRNNINNKFSNITDAEILSEFDNSKYRNTDINISNFDKEIFLENAKKIFIYIQENSNQNNFSQLKEYLTEDLLKELYSELINTDDEIIVVNLYADLLQLFESDGLYIASVCFYGLIKTNNNFSEFEEVWHFQKYNEAGWLLSGIQQKT
ncbi:hypothetical protein CDSE_0274 [Candidatus Kinetoplastibacterium desouzaii TCC079E]|uniref:Tim44-like domain-containing protein n=1 Tax=Candidatus Kinetoplastidibacterium desouzai TCC079E TaxID=1208919 RepID=M1LLJ0_9PROT|nr:Tim44-like domain-containing protein [Candidatus Kinetoplastibacterium desouzaii]AGF46622.1 hypothetical protein CDSE_0274 [Candidatus Kinetoplastibacterium desouzaii TCC079E]